MQKRPQNSRCGRFFLTNTKSSKDRLKIPDLNLSPETGLANMYFMRQCSPPSRSDITRCKVSASHRLPRNWIIQVSMVTVEKMQDAIQGTWQSKATVNRAEKPSETHSCHPSLFLRLGNHVALDWLLSANKYQPPNLAADILKWFRRDFCQPSTAT